MSAAVVVELTEHDGLPMAQSCAYHPEVAATHRVTFRGRTTGPEGPYPVCEPCARDWGLRS